MPLPSLGWSHIRTWTPAYRPTVTKQENKNHMSAYILRRILFMIPTIFGIMLVSFVVVQFAPGGPVERVIAQLSGSDTGATSRISGSSGGDFGARGMQGGAQGDINSK